MRTVKADLHNHLKTTSRMYQLDFNKVIDRTEKRLGPGGILGLINFDDQRYEEFSELPGYERVDLGSAFYVPEKDILVVKGQEVPTKEGHLLLLGLEKYKHVRGGRTLSDTIKEAGDCNGVIIADHPCYREGIGPYLKENPQDIAMIDAIETNNSEAALWIPKMTPGKANYKAQGFYNRIKDFYQNLGQMSSSDGHSIFEIGSSYIKIQMPDDYQVLTNSEQLNENLKLQIKSARSESSQKRGSSRTGAFLHAVKLAIITFFNKTRFGSIFLTKEQYRLG